MLNIKEHSPVSFTLNFHPPLLIQLQILKVLIPLWIINTGLALKSYVTDSGIDSDSLNFKYCIIWFSDLIFKHCNITGLHS